jgi:hypothetical protein
VPRLRLSARLPAERAHRKKSPRLGLVDRAFVSFHSPREGMEDDARFSHVALIYI